LAVPNRKLHREPHDVRRRLDQLGLQEEWLQNAVQVGQLQRLNCTLHHPPSFPALSAWAETIKTLRDILVPEGFLVDNPRGLPIVFHQKRRISITVATGDEATGREEFDPCTKSPKGPQTRSNISNNQLKLFPNEELAHAAYEQTIAKTGYITWLLLIHSDTQAREVRCELSLPIGMNEEGRVDGWEERIILGSTPFDADKLKVPTDETPQSPNIIVNVKRRA
jgi:hypothetical protein